MVWTFFVNLWSGWRKRLSQTLVFGIFFQQANLKFYFNLPGLAFSVFVIFTSPSLRGCCCRQDRRHRHNHRVDRRKSAVEPKVDATSVFLSPVSLHLAPNSHLSCSPTSSSSSFTTTFQSKHRHHLYTTTSAQTINSNNFGIIVMNMVLHNQL